MSNLPPPVPPPLDYFQPLPQRNDLRQIAVKQKGIMFCILGYIAIVVFQFVVPAELKLILLVAAMAVAITATVFVFMLAMSIYNTGAGIVLGICTLIPIVGLIVLLVVNGKATSILRQHGVQVGLLGAKSSQIPSPGTTPR